MNRSSRSARLAAALVAPTFFSGPCARGKAWLQCFPAPRGAQANPSAADVVYEALNTCPAQSAAANWSPRGQFFSLFINSTSAVWGLLPGWGALAFVWLESAGVDAIVALGRAVRAPIQRDVFAQSDRQGGASLWRDSSSLWCDIRAPLCWRDELPYDRLKRRADRRWRRRHVARRSR